MMTRFLTFSLLITALPLLADSPIKPGSELTLISDEFELADGPSWDGWSLTIPDPLGEQTRRLTPAKDEWQDQFKGKRFSASFFNHGHHYFADNGNGAIVKRDYLTKDLKRFTRKISTRTRPANPTTSSSTGQAASTSP